MKIIVKDIEKNYNVSSESDLKSFFKWIWVIFLILFSLYIILILVANLLVNFISLEDEKKYFWDVGFYYQVDEEKTAKIKDLLWEDLKYDIEVVKMNEENAFSMPWWKILITDSLLSSVKYENSLIFIIWHEVWHSENRDFLKWVIREAPISFLFSLLWVSLDIDLSFLSSSSSTIYSKKVESDADEHGLEFLYKIKWEVSCATYFFQKDSSLLEDVSSFLSDHPMTSSRIENIDNLIKKNWYKVSNNCKTISF